MEWNNVKRKELIVFLFLCFTVFVILVIIAIISVTTNGNSTSSKDNYNQEVESERLFHYKIFSSTVHNETSLGILTLEEDLESVRNEGYITFFQDFYNTCTMISKIESGKTDYRCTGSCYCDTDQEQTKRRRSASSYFLTRGLFILVSAFSSVMAMKSAEEYFNGECNEILTNSNCPQHEIKSWIEECYGLQEDLISKTDPMEKDLGDVIYTQCADNLQFDTDRFSENKNRENNLPVKRFQCNGGCKVNPAFENKLGEIDTSKSHIPEDFNLETSIDWECPGERTWGEDTVDVYCDVDEYPNREEECIKLAEMKYYDGLVMPICAIQSIVKIGKRKKLSLCVGDFETVSCGEMEENKELPLYSSLRSGSKKVDDICYEDFIPEGWVIPD